jgi:hypothetical protein
VDQHVLPRGASTHCKEQERAPRYDGIVTG